MRKLLPIYLLLLLSATLTARQEISIQNITLQNAQLSNVSCLAVQCDVLLTETYNQLVLQGDSTDTYYLEVWLKDTVNYLKASKGFGTLTDSIGRLKSRTPIHLMYDVRLYGALTVYIPFAAINIPEGPQSIKPVFKVVDKKGKIIVPGFGATYTTVQVPPKIDIRVTVKHITVSEKDPKGEGWDYHLVNPDGVKPEVCWAIRYATRQLSRSPYEVNKYEYNDAEGRYSFEFTISKNDLFFIDVLDYDVTSFSDKVGSYKVSMEELQMLSGASINVKFDKVEAMDFILTIL